MLARWNLYLVLFDVLSDPYSPLPFGSLARPWSGFMDSSRTCNKCHSGARQAGDSWCVGCSSLESIAADLKRGWNSGALRVIAEDACVAAARAVRALRFAGNRLGDTVPRAEKSPGEPEEWSLEEVEEEPQEEARPRTSGQSTAAKSRPKRTRSPEEVRRPRPKTPPRPPPGHREREEAARLEAELEDEEHGRAKRKKHRGGTKHQQHTRQRDDGQQRVTHRPLGREYYERRPPPRANEER